MHSVEYLDLIQDFFEVRRRSITFYEGIGPPRQDVHRNGTRRPLTRPILEESEKAASLLKFIQRRNYKSILWVVVAYKRQTIRPPGCRIQSSAQVGYELDRNPPGRLPHILQEKLRLRSSAIFYPQTPHLLHHTWVVRAYCA
jgi:hypothetical protein